MSRFLTVLFLSAACLTIPNSVSGFQEDDSGKSQFAADDSGTTWRHTRFGWEDSRHWEPVTDLRPEPMPGMHPLAWAGLLTLSVLVMVVWASESDEVAALLPGAVPQRQRKSKIETAVEESVDESPGNRRA
jgi:hypothetical protein